MNARGKFSGAEFRSIPRTLPRGMVTTLKFMTAGYGGMLTLTLPFNLADGLFDPGRFGLLGLAGAVIFSVLLLLTMFRWCTVHPLAFLGFHRLHASPLDRSAGEPFVSILVPACNEAETMDAAIRSLIDLDYPAFEIIVIDDGSTDETLAIARQYEGAHGNCTVQVLTKPNGGKWSALNLGYGTSRGEMLLCVDADSRLARDTLWIAVARMQTDPRTVGVAGQVTIRNRDSMLMGMQALEYVVGNGAMRMALSQLGMVTIVPGAIGLYRRAILDAIAALPCNRRPRSGETNSGGHYFGPFSGETFAEDFQLSLSALALGGRVVYEPRAVAFTRGPSRVNALLSQRYRWMRGTWQVLAIYLRDLRPIALDRNPRLDWVVASCYTVDILVIPVVNFIFWAWLALAAATGVDLGGVLLWLAAMTLLNLMAATVYAIVQDDDLKLTPYSLFMDLYLSIVVNSAWAIAAFDEARGARMKWN